VRLRMILRSCLFVFVALLVAVGVGGCGSSTGALTWDVTPDTRTIAQGASTTYTVNFTTKHDINATVSLRVTGLPTNTTGTFNPQVISSTGTSSTLTIQTAVDTPIGTYQIHIFATELGQAEQDIVRTLIVTGTQGGPDFSLDVQPPDYIYNGFGAKSFSYFVTPLNNFSGDVAITVTGLSDDMFITSGPNPPTLAINQNGHSGAGGTFVLSIDPVGAIQTPVTITVTATSGSIVHTRTIQITIPNG
jgi:hypothetical protein